MNLEKKSDSKSKRKSKSSKKDSLKKERSNKKINSLKNLKVTELQNLLVAQKKIKSGKKAELISRILTKKERKGINCCKKKRKSKKRSQELPNVNEIESNSEETDNQDKEINIPYFT